MKRSKSKKRKSLPRWGFFHLITNPLEVKVARVILVVNR
jgi:hypothetical protein